MWWNRTETHVIDGRKIFIKNLRILPVNAQSLVRDEILSFCQIEPLAQRFPQLRFVISARYEKDSTSGDRAAWVLDNNIVRGGSDVFISSGYILDVVAQLPSLVPISEVLQHELTHIFQARMSRYWSRALAKQSRLRSLSMPWKYEFTSLVSRSEARKREQRMLRDYLAEMLRVFFIEGIATFAQGYREGELYFSVKVLNHLHCAAVTRASHIAQVWHSYCHIDTTTPKDASASEKSLRKQFFDSITAGKYDIGVHMAYTILYNGDTTFEEMLDWSDHKFTQRYVRACRDLSIDPVFSLVGRAPISYNKMLQELSALTS